MEEIILAQYPEIASEIKAMTDIDQDMREKNIQDGEFWDESVDLKNTARMKEIIDKIGWPTISKVGKKASHDAWLLVQHADKDIEFQKHCLGLMKQQPKGEVSLHNIAYLEDRVRVPQLYGTQFQLIEGKFVPREIEDVENVDQRRKEMGLNTLAESIENMHKKYNTKKQE